MSVLVDLIYTSEASEDGYYGHFSDHEVTFSIGITVHFYKQKWLVI